MISNIHHINFLVHDLDEAVSRYQNMLGFPAFRFDHLEQRSVRTARTKLGDCWFILVQPVDEKSVPARHLAQHGEGFFLLSLATDNLDKCSATISDNGGELIGPTRLGLDDWKVQDLDPDQFFGVQVQITEE